MRKLLTKEQVAAYFHREGNPRCNWKYGRECDRFERFCRLAIKNGFAIVLPYQTGAHVYWEIDARNFLSVRNMNDNMPNVNLAPCAPFLYRSALGYIDTGYVVDLAYLDRIWR